MINYLLFPVIVTAITLIYASYLDIKTRYIPFVTWMPMIVIGTFFSSFYWDSNDTNLITAIQFLCVVGLVLALRYLDSHQFKLRGFDTIPAAITFIVLFGIILSYTNIYLMAILVFCVLVFLLGKFGLMGGADVWALCFITLTVPVSPITGMFLLGLYPYLLLFSALGIGMLFTLIIGITHSAKKALVDLKYPLIVPVTIAFFILLFL